MGGQVAQAHRLAHALVAHLQLLGQVDIDLGVQAHARLLDLLHHSDPGERGGDGAQAKQGLVRIDGLARSVGGEAVAFLQHHLAVLHHRHGHAGHVVLQHALAHDAVDKGLQLPGGDRGAGGQTRAGRRCGQNRSRRRGPATVSVAAVRGGRRLEGGGGRRAGVLGPRGQDKGEADKGQGRRDGLGCPE